MVIVVARGKVSWYLGRGASSEVESIQAAFAVIDQRLAIASPVGRLQRVGRHVNHPPVPCRYIQYFNIAADIVSVRHEVVPGGSGDLDIPKQSLLDYVFVMRANEESHIDFISQRQTRNLLGRKGLTKPGDRHNIVRA